MVAKESNHHKPGFYDDQFERYLEVLLGDKDHKKVLEMMLEVDKAMRSSVSRPARFP